jgi:hypothetical protein
MREQHLEELDPTLGHPLKVLEEDVRRLAR